VDTGSSFTIVAPGLATALGLPALGALGVIELQTPAGQTAGAAPTLSSLRVGSAELRDVPIVVHDPGPGIDGILGNSFLAQYRLPLDAGRRQLHLRPAAWTAWRAPARVASARSRKRGVSPDPKFFWRGMCGNAASVAAVASVGTCAPTSSYRDAGCGRTIS
jgi:hypothetical protein